MSGRQPPQEWRLAEWRLEGWRPNEWLLRAEEDAPVPAMPVWGPEQVRAPVAVNDVLRARGELPDPKAGTASTQHEWVEHRDWIFSALLPPRRADGVLVLGGVEHRTTVLLDGTPAADIVPGPWPSEVAVPHTVDRIELVVRPDPGYIGQTNWSSHIHRLQPRFSSGWDWTARYVPVGLIEAPVLRPAGVVSERDYVVSAELAPDSSTGTIRVTIAGDRPVAVVVRDPTGRIVGEARGAGSATVRVSAPDVWMPNGYGAQHLYTVEVTDLATGHMSARQRGFRRVEWYSAEGEPADNPLRVRVNDRDVFLQGVNWTPTRHSRAEPGDDGSRLRLYADAGCTVLRVWGGAWKEEDRFYRLCDELGLLVWQDLPYSSSALDNEPPRTDEDVVLARRVAESYCRELADHPCLIAISGGNELQFVDDDGRIAGQITTAHPLIAAVREEVARWLPGVRFLSTSPSGPAFTGETPLMGRGVLEDVHGPWFSLPADELEAYWSADDSILRSEMGCQGAAAAETIRRYGGADAWPSAPGNPWWRHSSAWWHAADRDLLAAAGSLEEYVRLSQERQARQLAYAAWRTKSRGAAGFIVWMGHDVWPCPVNTSIIDVDGVPKTAYHALAAIFRSSREELRTLDGPPRLEKQR